MGPADPHDLDTGDDGCESCSATTTTLPSGVRRPRAAVAAGQHGRDRRRRRHRRRRHQPVDQQRRGQGASSTCCASSSDAIVVGAGTVRVEGYPSDASRWSWSPAAARCRRPSAAARPRPGADGDGVAPRRAWRRRARCWASEHVLVLGSHRVDLARLKDELVPRGFRHLLSEGGPHLLRDLLDQGVRRRARHHGRAALVGGGAPPDHRRPARRRTPAAGTPWSSRTAPSWPGGCRRAVGARSAG